MDDTSQFAYFDAALGLLGMLNVVLQRRLPGGSGSDGVVRWIESWILGQV